MVVDAEEEYFPEEVSPCGFNFLGTVNHISIYVLGGQTQARRRRGPLCRRLRRLVQRQRHEKGEF